MKVGQLIKHVVPLMVIIVAILVLMANERQRAIADSELRARQRENQQLQRALNQLQAPDAAVKLRAFAGGMGAIRLSFIESLNTIKELPGVMDLRYVLANSRAPSPHPDYLRSTIRLELQHAESLLAVVEHLNAAASIWPYLLRGCAMFRQEVPDSLAVTCFYDVYVWDALS